MQIVHPQFQTNNLDFFQVSFQKRKFKKWYLIRVTSSICRRSKNQNSWARLHTSHQALILATIVWMHSVHLLVNNLRTPVSQSSPKLQSGITLRQSNKRKSSNSFNMSVLKANLKRNMTKRWAFWIEGWIRRLRKTPHSSYWTTWQLNLLLPRTA